LIALAPAARANDSAGGPTPDCSGTTCTVTYGYTGSPQTFTVPTGIASVSSTVMGAAGGSDARAGKGGSTAATLPVTAGDQLTVVVGQQGAYGDTVGTYGGGGPISAGSQGTSGGGGSFVFDSGLLLAAGGGGGHAGIYDGDNGGGGGGATGDTGHGYPDPGFYFYSGATGGTQSAAGTGGQFYLFNDSYVYGQPGTAGSGPAFDPSTIGHGGHGGTAPGEEYGGGGGGGGGYYGGGGGGHYQGGGGGSGFASATATDVTSTVGANSGAGTVTFEWEKAEGAQQLLVTSAPPSDAVVGDSHVLTVTGGKSSSPIAVGVVADPAGGPGVCSVGQVTGTVVDGAQRVSAPITFDSRGSCRLVIMQDGDDNFAAATPSDVTIAVAAKPTTTTLDISDADGNVVYGEALTTTVHTTPGVAGTLYLTTTSNSGSPTIQDHEVTATDSGITTLPLPLPVGPSQVGARFTPEDLDTHAESVTSADRAVAVSPATSVTTLRVTSDALIASVAAGDPSSAVPEGTVSFSVGGTPLAAPVQLHGGTASLPYRVPAGRTQQLRAIYSGQSAHGIVEITDSLATTARQDPTMTATVSSSAPKTRSGWYSRPATVRFACTRGSGALTSRCPAPVTLSRDGVHTITRTVLAEDGGATTRTVTVKIDRKRPNVTIRGVRAGRVYGQLPHVRCVASDATSGITSCRVGRHIHGDKVTYRATATDAAGNVRRTSVTARRARVLITGAYYGAKLPVVRRGDVYTLVVTSKARPSYVNSAPAPVRPRGNGGVFSRAGKNRWVYAVAFNRTKAHAVWRFGVKVGHKMIVVTVRIR
jgi:hypothetical protein